jgi:hypothetical protein
LSQYDKTHNEQTRDTCSIETIRIMDKPETHAELRQDTWWTNQRHMQYWGRTHNGQTSETGSIARRNTMDKPETYAVLRQDTWWTNQRHMQLWDKTHNGQTRDACSIETRPEMVKPETHAVWYLWFVHSLCALSQCLPVSLVCPFCIRLQ